MDENEPAGEAAGWVDKLFESARESAKATSDGLVEVASGVAEVGQSVAKMADAVTKLAGVVERTQGHASDTKHAVTAADWFWRQCKAVLTGHKKAVAGAMACLWFAAGPVSPADSQKSPIGPAQTVEQLLENGRVAAAELTIADRWRELGDQDGYWLLARVKKMRGEDGAATAMAKAAAALGHPDARRVTGS